MMEKTKKMGSIIISIKRQNFLFDTFVLEEDKNYSYEERHAICKAYLKSWKSHFPGDASISDNLVKFLCEKLENIRDTIDALNYFLNWALYLGILITLETIETPIKELINSCY